MSPLPDAPYAQARTAGPADLAPALQGLRLHTLRLFAAWRLALGDALAVPQADELNPPRWELGHVGWFEEHWLARYPQRALGEQADPDAPRTPSRLPGADALYDSSRVAHATRWALPLPGADATLDYVAAVRADTLALLADAPADDRGLYFFRLVLMHEAMHAEAAAYMAQRLGLDVAAALPMAAPSLLAPELDGAEWTLPAAEHRLGRATRPGEGGFFFDNEGGARAVELPALRLDRAPLSWRRYLPFVEAGGYEDERWWDDAGRAWRRAQGLQAPAALRRTRDGGWQQCLFGRWQDLPALQPAWGLSAHEARAWCRWAGRRLPGEAEWERAAVQAQRQGEAFAWGAVWEWTASAFEPWPGFVPHPYRDYSLPWFDGRPVLRGAAFVTRPEIRDLRYRNYFPADRNDLFAGFRSCAAA